MPEFEANSPSPALYAVYCIDWVQRLASLPRVSHPIVSSMNRPRQTNFVTGRVLQSRGRAHWRPHGPKSSKKENKAKPKIEIT